MKFKFLAKNPLVYLVVTVLIVGSNYAVAQGLSFDLENLREQDSLLTEAYDAIKIQEAWEAILDSEKPLSPVRVGVVDTGINPNHQEFNNPLVDLGSFSRSILDDFYEGGHGTQVAGIIGANNVLGSGGTLDSNSPQMNGILSGVLSENEYVLDIHFNRLPEHKPDSISGMLVFSALESVVQNGASVVNMSFGFTSCSVFGPEETECVNDAQFFEIRDTYREIFDEVGVDTLFVAAAGNDDISATFVTPANLSNLDNVATVGATELSGNTREPHSNFGNLVNISAVGEHVHSPAPGVAGAYDQPRINILGNVVDGFSGTSASTPFVTGVAGLLKAINPLLTPLEIKEVIIETGDPINTDKPIGPRLNAHSAVCHEKALNCDSEGYDYALDYIRVDGNIPIVPGCTVDQNNQTVRFFDGFNDNSVNTGCTANFSKTGTFTESGGFLHYARPDALVEIITSNGNVIELATHMLRLQQGFSDGSGSFDIEIAFRNDPAGSIEDSFRTYGLFFSGGNSSLTFQVIDTFDGGQALLIGQFTSAGTRIESAGFNGQEPVLVRLQFNDATNNLLLTFSNDGGSTFVPFINPDGTPFTVPFFTHPGDASLTTFAFQEKLLSTTTTVAPNDISTSSQIVDGFRVMLLEQADGPPPVRVFVPE